MTEPSEKNVSVSVALAISRKQSAKVLTRRNSYQPKPSSLAAKFKFSDDLDKAGIGEDNSNMMTMEDLRLRLKKFMTHSTFAYYYENILLIFSILSAVEYIYETYLNSEEWDREQARMLYRVEVALGCLFMTDWLLCYFLADHKISFITSSIFYFFHLFLYILFPLISFFFSQLLFYDRPLLLFSHLDNIWQAMSCRC
jgi:hypothetical protein